MKHKKLFIPLIIIVLVPVILFVILWATMALLFLEASRPIETSKLTDEQSDRLIKAFCAEPIEEAHTESFYYTNFLQGRQTQITVSVPREKAKEFDEILEKTYTASDRAVWENEKNGAKFVKDYEADVGDFRSYYVEVYASEDKYFYYFSTESTGGEFSSVAKEVKNCKKGFFNAYANMPLVQEAAKI